MSHTKVESVHASLMRDMGTPREDGFNPIAPRSHRLLMDVGNPEVVRILGWTLWRTIDLDRHGRTGPKKLKRTPYAHDERGTLGPKHIAQDLDMKISNVRSALKRAAESGAIAIDEKGRISPRGDAPDPRRIHGEAWNPDFAVEPERGICTDILPKPLGEYFQRVDQTQAERWAADYLEIQKFQAKLKADAIAQARDAGAEIEKRWFEVIGFTPSAEPRGRPKSERKDSAVQLSLLTMPETSVQISLPGSNSHSVHNGFSNFEQPERFSEEISPSLFVSSEVLQSDYRVSGGAADSEIAETPPSPPPAPLNHSPAKNPPEKEQPDPVIEAVESKFGRKLAARDPLRAKFAELAAQFEIPKRSVIRFFEEKFAKKRAAGYSIDTPGALYKIAVEDLPGWIPQHRREIQSDLSWERTWERREPISATPEEQEPFDPLEFNSQMQALIAKKGMP